MTLASVKLKLPVVRQRAIEKYFNQVMELTLQKRNLELEASQLLGKLHSMPPSEELSYLRACLQALL
jgi:hypothetical protein